MPKIASLAAFLYLFSCSVVGAQLSVRSSPLSPTMADCQELAAYYGNEEHAAFETVWQCMKGPANVGAGQDVSSSCSLYPVYRAWPQCVSIELQACEIRQQQDLEFKICEERATKRAEREAADKSRLERELDNVNQIYDAAKKAQNIFMTTREAISNPKKVLYDSVRSAAQDRLRTLFDPNFQLHPEFAGEANEVYRLSQIYVQQGLAATQSPLIRDIQKASLDQIMHHFAQLQVKLNHALADMHGTDIQSAPSTGQRLPMPVGQNARVGKSGGDARCVMLQDHAQSEALMDRDQAAWLALVGSCDN